MCKHMESMVPSFPPLLGTPGKAEIVYGLRGNITPYFPFFFFFPLCNIAFPGILFLTAQEVKASASTNKHQRILFIYLFFK